MTRLLVPALLLAACAEAPPPATSNAAVAAAPGGAAPHVLVQVTGFAANEGKVQRCNDTVSQLGYVIDPAAPVRAVLILEGSRNRLQIVSRARGIVRNDDLPGWDMGRLCRAAVEGILPVLAQEPPAWSAGPPPGSPPPSVQLAPAPSPYGYPSSAPPPPPRGVAPPPPRSAALPAPGPMVPPALLPPPSDAPRNIVDLARRGEQSFAKGDYANALVAYAEANRIASSPPLLFDTAACYRMLGRPQEALRYVQLYLDRAPGAANRADAERLASELRRQLGDED